MTPSSTPPTDSTALSGIGITTTDANGNTVVTTPASFTSQYVTLSDGRPVTETVVIHNPSGALDGGSGNGGSSNAFFNNTGAVAGTFVAVGLVVVGIIVALGFLCFRQRRRQRLDREITAAAVAASAAASRSPLDEGDDIHSASGPTSESYTSTVNQPMQQYNRYGQSYAATGGYDSYTAPDPYGSHQDAYESHQGAYSDHPTQGPFDTPHGYDAYTATGAGAGADAGGATAAGYDGLPHEQQGYYFDPRDADRYEDEPPQTHYANDDAYGAYSGGEGSLDSPLERENPLHVSNSDAK